MTLTSSFCAEELKVIGVPKRKRKDGDVEVGRVDSPSRSFGEGMGRWKAWGPEAFSQVRDGSVSAPAMLSRGEERTAGDRDRI